MMHTDSYSYVAMWLHFYVPCYEQKILKLHAVKNGKIRQKKPIIFMAYEKVASFIYELQTCCEYG